MSKQPSPAAMRAAKALVAEPYDDTETSSIVEARWAGFIDREYAPLVEAAKAMEWAMAHDTKLSPEEWRRVKSALSQSGGAL